MKDILRKTLFRWVASSFLVTCNVCITVLPEIISWKDGDTFSWPHVICQPHFWILLAVVILHNMLASAWNKTAANKITEEAQALREAGAHKMVCEVMERTQVVALNHLEHNELRAATKTARAGKKIADQIRRGVTN